MKWVFSMLHRRQKYRKNIRGQSMVEFALLLPVFLMLVMGVIDIARAYSNLQVITNATREGARLGIIPGTAPATVTAAVNNYLVSGAVANCGAPVLTNVGTGGGLAIIRL
jgi:Flp pilus assembly protein TadG